MDNRTKETVNDDEPPVIGAGAGLPPMPTQEDRAAAWRSLYIARMVSAGLDEESAAACFDACGFGPNGYDLTEDPADCADDELSYWTDDGDPA